MCNSRWPSWAPGPNKPTVSVDVKQHFNLEKETSRNDIFQMRPGSTELDNFIAFFFFFFFFFFSTDKKMCVPATARIISVSLRKQRHDHGQDHIVW